MLYQTENQHGGDVYGGGITLDFSANTNPLGTPPGVLEAVCRALPQLHRYPDPYCRRLVQAIAGHEQVPASYILCGNGAADLIYAYCTALRPRTAVELAPTFAEYGAGLAQVGCRVERYFLHQAQNFDLDERFLSFLEEKKPEAVFLCNPNNPTGRLIPLAAAGADPAILRGAGGASVSGRVLPRSHGGRRQRQVPSGSAPGAAAPEGLYQELRHGRFTARVLPVRRQCAAARHGSRVAAVERIHTGSECRCGGAGGAGFSAKDAVPRPHGAAVAHG